MNVLVQQIAPLSPNKAIHAYVQGLYVEMPRFLLDVLTCLYAMRGSFISSHWVHQSILRRILK